MSWCSVSAVELLCLIAVKRKFFLHWFWDLRVGIVISRVIFHGVCIFVCMLIVCGKWFTKPLSLKNRYSARWAKKWHPILVFEFSLLVFARILYAIFVYSSSADANKFRFYANKLQFVSTLGSIKLTNDEGCLIHDLRVQKHCSSEKITKKFSIK